MQKNSGRVVWFTGLSGAGKSTLCINLAAELRKRGESVQILDADELRQGLCSDLGFSSDDRAENVRRTLHVAALWASNGGVVLVAMITPFQALRDLVRTHLSNLIEVFVDAPLSVCEQRDPKGLYKKARAGDIPNFTGIDSPYEVPSKPDLICNTSKETIEMSVSKVLESLASRTDAFCPPINERCPTIAVDFDGVIANYDGWQGERMLGAPRKDVIAALKQLKAENWKVVVHTTRRWDYVHAYLLRSGVPFDEVNANTDYPNLGPKPVATIYWDDRALCYSGDGMRDLQKIRSFTTWNGRN